MLEQSFYGPYEQVNSSRVKMIPVSMFETLMMLYALFLFMWMISSLLLNRKGNATSQMLVTVVV